MFNLVKNEYPYTEEGLKQLWEEDYGGIVTSANLSNPELYLILIGETNISSNQIRFKGKSYLNTKPFFSHTEEKDKLFSVLAKGDNGGIALFANEVEDFSKDLFRTTIYYKGDIQLFLYKNEINLYIAGKYIESAYITKTLVGVFNPFQEIEIFYPLRYINKQTNEEVIVDVPFTMRSQRFSSPSHTIYPVVLGSERVILIPQGQIGLSLVIN